MRHDAESGFRLHLPIRVRLTLWYLVLAGAAILVFAAFQYYRLQDSLSAAVDRTLEIAATQAMTSIDSENGLPSFQNSDTFNAGSGHLGQDDFVVQLLAPDGSILEKIGTVYLPAPDHAVTAGFSTQVQGGQRWRVYTQPVSTPTGKISGWLQSAQSLARADQTMADVRRQLLLGLPLILILIAAGGVLLADRALHAIDQITRTAQAWSPTDLTQRIGYRGPPDEIGRLAKTIDEMLERLQAAFERERRFTGDAAHELRTPLTALKGQIEVTLLRDRQASDYRTTLTALAGQVDRLIRLSDGLLFLSRADGQRIPMRAAPTNLTELLGAVAVQMQPLIDTNRLSLTTDIEAGVWSFADRDLLIQLLFDLLDNAIKHTPSGGKVALVLLRDHQDALISVADSGPGIPSEHLPHLFERFYRVEQDRSRRTGGVGLGLAIVREIARLHGGEVTVHSTVGAGSTFQVRLPLSPDERGSFLA
jgi:heavy metal sensor kinase